MVIPILPEIKFKCQRPLRLDKIAKINLDKINLKTKSLNTAQKANAEIKNWPNKFFLRSQFSHFLEPSLKFGGFGWNSQRCVL